MLRLLILLLGLSLQVAQATPLSPIEKRITGYITEKKDQQLLLLEQLVNINSGTTNILGVLQVGKILEQQFAQLGFKTRWVEEPPSMHRAPTLVAERQASKGKRVLLIGHLDTVFPKKSPFQTFVRNENKATGPGIIDDKGGDVVILYALKALQFGHVLDDATITVVLTGDEEDSGKPTSISRKPLFDAARKSDVALDFESAITADTAIIARRGISRWILQAQGNEGHSSQIFQQDAGYGAIFELTRILDTARIELAKEKYLSFNPGVILGGTSVNYKANNGEGIALGKDNVIAKMALAKGDLRFLTLQQKLATEKRLQDIAQQHLPGTTASIRFQVGIPAMPPTPGNSALLKIYSDVSNDLGYGDVKSLDPGSRGAADISHIASLVAMNLSGLGALGTGFHSTDETLDINSLPMQTQRAALLIYRCSKQSRQIP